MWGWGWPCFDTNLFCFLVEMYAREEQHDLHVHNKAARVVSKQRQLQDHFHNCKMGLARKTHLNRSVTVVKHKSGCLPLNRLNSHKSLSWQKDWMNLSTFWPLLGLEFVPVLVHSSWFQILVDSQIHYICQAENYERYWKNEWPKKSDYHNALIFFTNTVTLGRCRFTPVSPLSVLVKNWKKDDLSWYY